MARYIDADNFRKTMIKRFGCIPCLTDYSEASIYDIPLDDALNLAPTADVVPKAEVELLKRQLEPFKEVQCFTCKHYDIGHDHVPCCYCKDYDKYIWLSIDADTDIHVSNENEVDKCKADVAREIFEEIEKLTPKKFTEKSQDFEFGYALAIQQIKNKIAELKKEYTED